MDCIRLAIDCIRFACSKEAGDFLFGKDKPFEIFPNAIDCEQFRFSEEKRKEVRKALNIENCFVMGHIGRYEEQKNHRKLIEILKAVSEKRPNAILMSIGDGVLMDDVKTYSKELGVYDKVLFLGQRKDVSDLINAFDVFLLPSLYEGFGIVQIEAQANGLHCFSSQGVIPAEADITGNVSFIPLEESSERDLNAIQTVKNKGYDSHLSAQRLTEVYESLV